MIQCSTCDAQFRSRKAFKQHLLQAHRQYVAYGSDVPTDLDPDEADRRLALLERHQRGSNDRLPLRVRMQCRDHPFWRPIVVAEGRVGGNLGGGGFGTSTVPSSTLRCSWECRGKC